MGEIILKADNVEFIDEVCRKAVERNFMNINKINERTKDHTAEMRELRKRIKKLEDIVDKLLEKKCQA